MKKVLLAIMLASLVALAAAPAFAAATTGDDPGFGSSNSRSINEIGILKGGAFTRSGRLELVTGYVDDHLTLTDKTDLRYQQDPKVLAPNKSNIQSGITDLK